MSEKETLTGIVLKSAPAGEYDRRIVLLTKEHGKITAFVRGARRPKSALQAATGLFTLASFEGYEGKTAWTIVRAQIREHFRELVTDLDRTAYGCYFLEVADYFCAEGEEATGILNLVYVTLRALLKGQVAPALIRRIYELRLLYYNGTYPQVFSCASCGKAADQTPLVCFSFAKHGCLCRDCAGERDPAINAAASYALRYILSAPLQKLYSFQLAEDAFLQIDQIVGRVFQSYIDRPFNSEDFLQASLEKRSGNRYNTECCCETGNQEPATGSARS